MKLIFLDIDGVLATRESYKTVSVLKVGSKRYSSLDLRAIVNLQLVLDQTKADVVISSSWRKLYSLAELRHILDQESLDCQVVGVTPSHAHGRGAEITQFLVTLPTPPVSYVILDDDAYDIEDEHPNNLVYVKDGFSKTGLTYSQAQRAIQILEGRNDAG